VGQVAATYQLLPEETSFDMEELKSKLPTMLPAGITLMKATVKPFAFGLKQLEIVCVMNDAEGILDRLEESLRSIPGIQGVESTGITLI